MLPQQTLDFEQARVNMLTQQIRTVGVLDDHILQVIKDTPRELFVPEIYQNMAYADMAIPLAHAQVMLTPQEEARMLQALHIKKTDTVLEIGTGTGYMTALLAKLAKQVESVDIFPDFTAEAQQKLSNLGLHNVQLVTGDAATGWGVADAYDVVAITGSLPYLPEGFRPIVKLGGRLMVILGQKPAMVATLLTRDGAKVWREESLFETVVPALLNAKAPPVFNF